MVSSLVSPTPPGTTTQRRPARIIELVGPAGAGKTTVANSLLQKDPTIRVAPDISLRKPEHLAISILGVTSLGPILRPTVESAERFNWAEIKSIVYLTRWPRVLREQAANSSGAILVDQGPVFRLATLHAFGSDSVRGASAVAWWNKMFGRWASALDLVIWLDAPNAVLNGRINARDRWHVMKGKPEQETCQFLDRYRASYDYVLTNLSMRGGPTIARFDTSQTSTHELVASIMDVCALNLGQK